MYLQHALMSCRGLIRSRVVLGMSLWRNSCRQVAAALSGKSEAVSLLNNFCIAHQGKLSTDASGLAGAGPSGATLDMSSSTAGLTLRQAPLSFARASCCCWWCCCCGPR